MTWLADRSSGRTLFVYACGSTALLCPLIFGFPTEMWFAQAVFWPTLAVSHYAKRTIAGAALVFLAQLVLAFTHEGALVLLFAIVATLAAARPSRPTLPPRCDLPDPGPDIGGGFEIRVSAG